MEINWNETWSRKYEKYNRRHSQIWNIIKPIGRIVDLGCGPCCIYENKVLDLTGIDLSEEALKQAKIHYPRGKYILADARDTKLKDKEFDTCVMFGLLDYFEDWSEVLKEAKRITKGKIFATLLNGYRGHDWTNYKFLTANWYLYEDHG